MVKVLHGEDGGFNVGAKAGLKKGCWQGIVATVSAIDNLDIPFSSSVIKKVCNGENTRFWLDTWHHLGFRFKDQFPRLFALELSKDCSV